MGSRYSNCDATKFAVGLKPSNGPSVSECQKCFGRVGGQYEHLIEGIPGAGLVFHGANVGADCGAERSACDKGRQGMEEAVAVGHTRWDPAP